MEEKIKIKIKTKDDFTIFGTLNYRGKDTKNLIIFVHGLTDHQNAHVFYNASRFFPRHNFATFRFNLYHWEEGGRKFKDISLFTHAEDLELVIEFFKDKYDKIFLVGHSMGGPTILLANLGDINGIVLWDPSYDFNKFMKKMTRFDEISDFHILDGAFEIIVRKDMYESLTTKFPDCFESVQNLKLPLKIIAAGEGLLVDGAKKYFKVANEPKELSIISGASHCFDEEGTEEKLFDETLNWIKSKQSQD